MPKSYSIDKNFSPTQNRERLKKVAAGLALLCMAIGSDVAPQNTTSEIASARTELGPSPQRVEKIG